MRVRRALFFLDVSAYALRGEESGYYRKGVARPNALELQKLVKFTETESYVALLESRRNSALVKSPPTEFPPPFKSHIHILKSHSTRSDSLIHPHSFHSDIQSLLPLKTLYTSPIFQPSNCSVETKPLGFRRPLQPATCPQKKMRARPKAPRPRL